MYLPLHKNEIEHGIIKYLPELRGTCLCYDALKRKKKSLQADTTPAQNSSALSLLIFISHIQ